MFDKLEKHHLGFIISLEDIDKIEVKYGKKFHYDKTQETHVLFVYDEIMHIFIEFICQEGRVAKRSPGFYHVCYSVQNQEEFKKLEGYIQKNKMGYQLTRIEKSGSEECGDIVFYFIKNQGVVELNILQGE